jgi:4-hydroxy-3-polyprenylbenzoate decarboxylase
LHVGHLRLLTAAAESGALILPPIPAFYSRPASLDDVINHTVGRVLDHFGIEHAMVKRWGEKQADAGLP